MTHIFRTNLCEVILLGDHLHIREKRTRKKSNIKKKEVYLLFLQYVLKSIKLNIFMTIFNKKEMYLFLIIIIV